MVNYQIINTEDGVGLRLDMFLFRELVNKYPEYKITRSFVSNNASKFVLVNDEVKKKGYIVKSNDKVEIDKEGLEKFLKQDRNTEILPQKGNLDIIYEDDHILVINKASGVVVHLGDGNKENTLVNHLRYYFESKGIDCNQLERCGLVHRLDKGVSGLMIIAKDRETQFLLKKQFEEHKVVKIYKAKVVGEVEKIDRSRIGDFVISNKTAKEELDAFVKNDFKVDSSWSRVEGYIKRDRINRKRMRFNSEKEDLTSKYALSYFKFLKNNEVLIKIETGRMHQIRATLKFLGLVIEGDTLYSSGNKNSNLIALSSVLLGANINANKFMHWELI
ncbi:MAG TPA: RluA family pseudouridine synthase [Candidatus Dojkabacteria bacterium]|nr:RluA family pseudouridine synthase [Candidatus Dojkabacteria bacterium]